MRMTVGERLRTDVCDGFTLVETLVALVILSLISLFVFMSLKTGTALWTGYSRTADATDELTVSLDIIRELVEQAYPAIQSTVGANGNLTFRGLDTAVELDTRLPRRINGGGYNRVKVSLNGDGQVVLSWSDPLAVDQVDRQRTVLIRNVSEFRFAYFGRKGQSDSAQWYPDWTEQPRLPELVRLSIRRAENELRSETVVATKLTADATCVYDALTGGCRGR